jgi:opacity protein-like surface antigen
LKNVVLLSLLLVGGMAFAQTPVAIPPHGSLWIGGEYSSFNPDYGCSNNSPFGCSDGLLQGAGVFGDLNLRPTWGAEAEARWLKWNTVGGEKQSSYVIGPRYEFLRYSRLSIWAKILLGGGWITTPYYPHSGLKGSYFMYTPGATVSYSLDSHFDLRADYEYQFWPSFVGPPTQNPDGGVTLHNHGLTPDGFSIGLAYRIVGR